MANLALPGSRVSTAVAAGVPLSRDLLPKALQRRALDLGRGTIQIELHEVAYTSLPFGQRRFKLRDDVVNLLFHLACEKSRVATKELFRVREGGIVDTHNPSTPVGAPTLNLGLEPGGWLSERRTVYQERDCDNAQRAASVLHATVPKSVGHH